MVLTGDMRYNCNSFSFLLVCEKKICWLYAFIKIAAIANKW